MIYNKCFKKIDANGTKTMLEENDGAMLLDVRETDEYSEGHITGSANIPVGLLPVKPEALPEDKESPIITYCLSGMRAKTACKVLSGLGYSNIYCLGGLGAWPYGFVR